MDPQTKKCPLCAEFIPLEAATCEYCGALFEITSLDGRTLSRFIGEALPSTPAPPVLPVSPPPQSPVQPSTAPEPPFLPPMPPGRSPGRRGWAGWLIGGLFALGVLAVIALLVFQVIPLPSLLVTPTSTRTPTRTPNRTATRQALNSAATATAQFRWVEEFARPILDDVHALRPNFEDDFSTLEGYAFRWPAAWPGTTFPEGVMRIDTTGQEWVGSGGSLIAVDFVLEYSFLPRTVSPGSGVCTNFRAGELGGYNFCLNLDDERCDFGAHPSGGDWVSIAVCSTSAVNQVVSTSVTIIARGDRFAFFVNGQPLLYAIHPTYKGDWIDLGVYAPNGTAEVDYDDIRLWDLNNLRP